MQCLNLSACCLLWWVTARLAMCGCAACPCMDNQTRANRPQRRKNSTAPSLEPQWIHEQQACTSGHTERTRNQAVCCDTLSACSFPGWCRVVYVVTRNACQARHPLHNQRTRHAAMQCLNLSACCLLGCVRVLHAVPYAAAQHAHVWRIHHARTDDSLQALHSAIA